MFKVIFYKLYVWACKYNFANSPHLSAMYMLSLLLFLNLLGLVSLVKLIAEGDGYVFFNNTVGIIILMLILFFIINYAFIRNGRYKTFCAEFDLKPSKQRKMMSLFTFIYIIFSVALPFGIAIYIGYYRNR